MKDKKAIIYDWDGTLCDTIPLAFKATQRIFELHGAEPPTFETYVATFGPPYTPFYYDNGLPRSVSEKQIWETYVRESNGHDAALFDDVYETLCLQRSYGYRIGLVTGQNAHVIAKLMDKHKCTELFDCVYCQAMPNKVDLFRQSCQDLGVKTHEACSVGDFATDIRDSLKAEVTPIGIVRNGHDVSSILLAAGAQWVIRSIAELQVN